MEKRLQDRCVTEVLITVDKEINVQYFMMKNETWWCESNGSNKTLEEKKRTRS
jgi:hypothetical protein